MRTVICCRSRTKRLLHVVNAAVSQRASADAHVARGLRCSKSHVLRMLVKSRDRRVEEADRLQQLINYDMLVVYLNLLVGYLQLLLQSIALLQAKRVRE